MIVSAHIKDISVQADGRAYVTEIQVDDVLGDMEFFYLAAQGADVNAIMEARSVEINAVAALPIPPPATPVEIVGSLVAALDAGQRAAVLSVATALAAGELTPEEVVSGS